MANLDRLKGHPGIRHVLHDHLGENHLCVRGPAIQLFPDQSLRLTQEIQ
jgi:hypothetical protein